MQPLPGRCPQEIDGEFSAGGKNDKEQTFHLRGKKKKLYMLGGKKKCNEVNWCFSSFFFGHSDFSPRVPLKRPRKKSSAREMRISVLATVRKKYKKERFNFFYLAFYLGWNCDSKHNKLPRLVFLPFTSDIYTLTR